MKDKAPKRQAVFDFLLGHPEYVDANYKDVWRAMQFVDISFDTIVKAQIAYRAWQSNEWQPELDNLKVPNHD